MWIYYIFDIKLITLLNFLRAEKIGKKKKKQQKSKTKPTATRKKLNNSQKNFCNLIFTDFWLLCQGLGPAISSTTQLRIQFFCLHICLLAMLKSLLNPFCHKVNLPSSCIICLQGIFTICETETNFKLQV